MSTTRRHLGTWNKGDGEKEVRGMGRELKKNGAPSAGVLYKICPFRRGSVQQHFILGRNCKLQIGMGHCGTKTWGFFTNIKTKKRAAKQRVGRCYFWGMLGSRIWRVLILSFLHLSSLSVLGRLRNGHGDSHGVMPGIPAFPRFIRLLGSGCF